MAEKQKTLKEQVDEIFRLRNAIRAPLIAMYPDPNSLRRKRWKAITRKVGAFMSLGQGYRNAADTVSDIEWLKKIFADLGCTFPPEQQIENVTKPIE